jgi:hypothetical protein
LCLKAAPQLSQWVWPASHRCTCCEISSVCTWRIQPVVATPPKSKGVKWQRNTGGAAGESGLCRLYRASWRQSEAEPAKVLESNCTRAVKRESGSRSQCVFCGRSALVQAKRRYAQYQPYSDFSSISRPSGTGENHALTRPGAWHLRDCPACRTKHPTCICIRMAVRLHQVALYPLPECSRAEPAGSPE